MWLVDLPSKTNSDNDKELNTTPGEFLRTHGLRIHHYEVSLVFRNSYPARNALCMVFPQGTHLPGHT